MINLNFDEQQFIKDNFTNGEELIRAEKVNDLLDYLNDWILAFGFNDDYSLNDIGRKAQRMYDDIYYRNYE